MVIFNGNLLKFAMENGEIMRNPKNKQEIRSTQLNIWLGNRIFLGEKNCRKLPQGTPIEIHRRGLWSSLIFGHTRIVYR